MNLVWIEVLWWYDWISHWIDQDTWRRYSRVAKKLIDSNQLCRYNKIYTVKSLWDYNYEVLSEEDDVQKNWDIVYQSRWERPWYTVEYHEWIYILRKWYDWWEEYNIWEYQTLELAIEKIKSLT